MVEARHAIPLESEDDEDAAPAPADLRIRIAPNAHALRRSLYVAPSTVIPWYASWAHGPQLGIFAQKCIAPGTLIGAYTGRVYDTVETYNTLHTQEERLRLEAPPVAPHHPSIRLTADEGQSLGAPTVVTAWLRAPPAAVRRPLLASTASTTSRAAADSSERDWLGLNTLSIRTHLNGIIGMNQLLGATRLSMEQTLYYHMVRPRLPPRPRAPAAAEQLPRHPHVPILAHADPRPAREQFVRRGAERVRRIIRQRRIRQVVARHIRVPVAVVAEGRIRPR